jgi:outer membrane protein assembly factor BamB
MSANAYSQWPQWRGPARNGTSSESGLLKKWPAEGPSLVWSAEVGEGFSSAIIQDQLVFTAGKKDSVEIVTALDLKGNIKWQGIAGRALMTGEWQQSRCTPTCYKNKVYALTALGDLACFDAKTGKTDWKMRAFEKFGGNFQSAAESPLVIDDKVILTPCGYQTTMVALDRITGKTIWKSETLRDSNYFGTPVLLKAKDKNYIFQSTKQYDFIADPKNGQIIWKETRASESMVPQLINNQVYFSGGGTKGGSLCHWSDDLKKRNALWNDTIRSLVISGSAAIGNKLIVSGLPRGLCLIDMQTGKLLSRYNRIRTCNFLVAGDQLYCYEDGTARVYLFNVTESGFQLVSSFKTANGTGPSIAHMSISNGLLFVRHGTALMAYNIREGS